MLLIGTPLNTPYNSSEPMSHSSHPKDLNAND